MTHLIICREFPPAPSGGGIGTYVEHISGLLASRGETVHVIGQLWPGAPRPREVRHNGRLVVHRIAAEEPWRQSAAEALGGSAVVDLLSDPLVPGGFMWHAAIAAESIVEATHVDLIEAQEYEAPLFALMLRRARQQGPVHRPPLVVHLHTPTEFVLAANHWQADLRAHATLIELEAAVIRAADALRCPSHFLARIAERHYRLGDGVVEIIPYPIGDTAWVDRDEKTWRDGTICYAGRLEPRKGVGEWIEAAVAVSTETPLRFTLIGRDTAPTYSSEGSVRASLTARIPRKQRERFQFVDGIARRQVLAHLAQARIAVVPSRWENFPFACIEAMASGLPVLVTPNGGMPEMIEDGRTGWVADGADARSLERALRRALSTSSASLAEMGQAAAASITQLCDNERIVERHLEFCRRVVDAGSATLAPASLAIAPPPPATSATQTRVVAGQTMTIRDILRAPPRTQLAVIRRAVRNPGYVARWVAWQLRPLSRMFMRR